MSWFASDEELARHEFFGVDDEWRVEKSGEKEFVDVALHVGNYEIVRIILPSGQWWTLGDAEKIRDALTRQIEHGRKCRTK